MHNGKGKTKNYFIFGLLTVHLKKKTNGLYILKWFLFAEEHFFIKTISYFENSN